MTDYGVDQAISKVPINKINPGLEYDRLKWRRREIELSLEIINELKNANELVRPDLLCKERIKISRSLIYKKRYKEAYDTAKNHFLSNGPEYAEAEWLSGWIALTFLNNPNLALKHFKNFYEGVGYPISLARGAYWIGITYEKLGNSKFSENFFKEGSKYLTTYYGQLSFKKINPYKDFELNDESKFSEKYQKEFEKNPLYKHTILLKELNE